jgi:sugar lactone lactonase YvrE
MTRRALLLGVLLAGCALRGAAPHTAAFDMQRANSGPELYSAWFADSDGRIFYFGLTAFWERYWANDHEPLADLREFGDHLIGRFDLATESFLEPLRVRSSDSGARSSVWDVLAHSNGRIYYTTFYEQIGWVAADGSDMRVFQDLGTGFNELTEGPDGNVYATRYAGRATEDAAAYGSVVVLSPDGALVNEFVIANESERFTAPKSLAVDPRSGEIWLNTDTFGPGEAIAHETIRLRADGSVLERREDEVELHFVAFDAAGRGWFAESVRGRLRLRVMDRDKLLATLSLGPRKRGDFIQDIHFASDGTAVLARWSRVVHLVRLGGGTLEQAEIVFDVEPECAATRGPKLLYTAVLHARGVFATLHCGGRVARTEAPPDFWQPARQ